MIEIKRPTQKINSKVVAQGESYASVLNACSEFDPTRTKWDLFLVSGEIDDNVVNLKRRKGDRAFGHIDTMGNVRLWAFTWGEIIEAARDEMRMVRDKLEMKSLELSSSEVPPEALSESLSANGCADPAVKRFRIVAGPKPRCRWLSAARHRAPWQAGCPHLAKALPARLAPQHRARRLAPQGWSPAT